MKHFFWLVPAFCATVLSAQSRYLTPIFEQIIVTKNVQYGMNATVQKIDSLGEVVPQPLLLDLYAPAGDTLTARPLVLVLHGGGYLPASENERCDGSKSDSVVVEICTRLAKMGYLAAAVDYRLGLNLYATDGFARWNCHANALYRGIQDARTAIRYFKKTAVEDANPFRVDTSRIVLWGESTGGELTLGAAYANSPSDWESPGMTVLPYLPVVRPMYNGNIWGTSLGVAPLDNPLGIPAGYPPGIPLGDTVCYPNWPGYSSDFQLGVSMGASIWHPDWIAAGEVPTLLFHALNDTLPACGNHFSPVAINFGLGTFGSCALAEKFAALGNNQVFENASVDDCVTSQALLTNGGLEGFYPFTGLAADQGRPWQWTAPCPANPNSLPNGVLARQYIDTVFAYFAPRACAALALCNVQPDPTGLCGPQAKGQAFLDSNQNALLEAGESPFPDLVLELQPGGYHAVSSSSGHFSISAPPNTYTLDVPDLLDYYALTDTLLSVSVPAGADIVQNIGLYVVATANDMEVSLTPIANAQPGFSNVFLVKWKNIGTTQLSGNVLVTVDSNYWVVGSAPPANISDNVAIWTFVNLPPLRSGSARLQVTLSTAASLGTVLQSTATVTPTGVADQTPANNVANAYQRVIGSFDPNDKQVSPIGEVSAGLLQDHGGWLDYTVRFQNTGTAPAANVYIVDTLPDLLNINTLEMISSSHPMRWEINGQRTVTFFFDNIQLPDSLHDEVSSHGFVRYRIKPLSPFEELLNKTARNFADIYFDFNAPVRTNTTETKFTVFVGVNSPLPTKPLRIFPNPVGDVATLEWTLVESSGTATLRVLNATGAVVLLREIPFLDGISQEKIPVKNWFNGVYFVQLRTQSGILSGRFIKG